MLLHLDGIELLEDIPLPYGEVAVPGKPVVARLWVRTDHWKSNQSLIDRSVEYFDVVDVNTGDVGKLSEVTSLSWVAAQARFGPKDDNDPSQGLVTYRAMDSLTREFDPSPQAFEVPIPPNRLPGPGLWNEWALPTIPLLNLASVQFRVVLGVQVLKRLSGTYGFELTTTTVSSLWSQISPWGEVIGGKEYTLVSTGFKPMFRLHFLRIGATEVLDEVSGPDQLPFQHPAWRLLSRRVLALSFIDQWEAHDGKVFWEAAKTAEDQVAFQVRQRILPWFRAKVALETSGLEFEFPKGVRKSSITKLPLEMRARIGGACLVRQRGAKWCNPAAVLVDLVMKQPELYALHLVSLVRNGRIIGDTPFFNDTVPIEVTAILPGPTGNAPDLADWIVMVAFRLTNVSNMFPASFDVDDAGDPGTGAGVPSWFDARDLLTNMCRMIDANIELALSDEEDELNYASAYLKMGGTVLIGSHTDLFKSMDLLDFEYHMVPLIGPVTFKRPKSAWGWFKSWVFDTGTYTMSYVTWGIPMWEIKIEEDIVEDSLNVVIVAMLPASAM